MCLVISKTDEEKTAKKDMVVYKVLLRSKLSPLQEFQYDSNTTYRLRKKLERKWHPFHNGRVISKGFHSYANVESASREFESSYEKYMIVKMVIPKGAKYYTGTRNDIVSTSIRTGNLNKVEAYV